MTQKMCNRCGEPIIWATALNGASLPFNRDPEPMTTNEGYVLRPTRPGYQGTLEARDRHEAMDDEPTHAFHLAVCLHQREKRPR